MNYDVTTVIWVLVASALIYFMQAGFALCEAGLTRAKNTGNILMKNLMDFCIGTPCYWLVGFGIMFGSTAPVIGRLDPMIRGVYDAGNTVVVIEHNLDVIRTADYIIDMGPEGGDGGGTVIASGTPEEIAANPAS